MSTKTNDFYTRITILSLNFAQNNNKRFALMKNMFIISLLCCLSLEAYPQKNVYDCIVAQDGTGNFATIQDAIDNAPANAAVPYAILIKAGHYHEHLYIPEDKPRLFLIGEDKSMVRVSDDRVSGGPNASPVDVAATLVSHATDGYFTGITFENSWGTRHKDGPQALALYTKRDRTIVNNCAMLSFQDTYRTANVKDERNYVKDCFIEGAIDFIYGQGNVFFDHCTLNIVRRDSGFIVAPKHDEGTRWGYVFRNTTITAPGNPADTWVWLGRPWLHAPKAVFIDTRAEVTIPAEGWFDHMASLPAVYADHNTTDANGKPLDLSRRTSMYYKITEQGDTIRGKAKNSLTPEEAALHTVGNVMGGDDNWNPLPFCELPDAPKVLIKKNKMAWAPVKDARGYAIRHNGRITALTTSTEYEVNGDPKDYDVATVGTHGNLSRPAR